MPRSRSKSANPGPARNATSHGPKARSSKHRSQRGQPSREPVVLKPRVRQISQATITSKWSPLSQTAQQHARDTLKAAKRSVVMSHWDERRRAEADVAITASLKKVEKSMTRLSVPPKTKDMFFNLDKLAESSVSGRSDGFIQTLLIRKLQRLLESQLTSAIHAAQLLKAEIDKEEDALEADRNRLAELHANAKAEYREQTKQASKVCSACLRCCIPIDCDSRPIRYCRLPQRATPRILRRTLD